MQEPSKKMASTKVTVLTLLCTTVLLNCWTVASVSTSRTRLARGLKLDKFSAGAKQGILGEDSFLARLLPFPVIQAATANSLNTSVSFTVPMFSLATNARTFDLTQLGIPQGSSNLLVLLAVSTVVIGIAVIFLPPFLGLLNTINTQGRSIDSSGLSSFMANGFSDFLYTMADNPMGSFPGVDPSECLKRCICEAHNSPKRYGWLAFPFQLFYPPYNGNQRDDDPKTVSKYQMAARYGKSDHANCGAQYNGCFFNPLDILQRVINWIFDKSRKK